MLERGVQVDPGVFDLFTSVESSQDILDFLMSILQESVAEGSKLQVITKDIVESFQNVKNDSKIDIVSRWEVLKDANKLIEPNTGPDAFVELFRRRFAKFQELIKVRVNRGDIMEVSQIRKLLRKKNVKMKLAGFVLERRLKGKQMSLVIEDLSGSIEAYVSDDIKNKVERILLDEFVFAELEYSEKGLVCTNISHIDIGDVVRPSLVNDVYACFVSDLHYGREDFDSEGWDRFLQWLSGRYGEEEIVSKIRYLFVVGDLVDVTGKDISFKQLYEELAVMFRVLPDRITIFIQPGDTDASRFLLPQTTIFRSVSKPLYTMKNIKMLGNPVTVSIDGIKILLFHGQSLKDIKWEFPSWIDFNVTDYMVSLLKARHLAPTYGMFTPIAPEKDDFLVIDDVPHIFVCGHLHQKGLDSYRNVLLLALPCWSFAEGKKGGRAAVVNLRNFDVVWRG